MTKAHSQLLVIDASVAQAAGPESASHETAKHCRDFLKTAGEICHRMVFTTAIKEEWDKHQSGFARRWRRSMFARKKIDRLDIVPDDVLREKLQEIAAKRRDKEAMLKDLHLIEAALAAASRVATLDDTVRELFRKAALSLPALRNVCWVNPANHDEEPLEWLRTGARAEPFRKLGYLSPEK